MSKTLMLNPPRYQLRQLSSLFDENTYNATQVVRFTKQGSNADNELMLRTKLEIKTKSRDNHFFKKVQVSRLNVLVSYKVRDPFCLLHEGSF